MSKVTVVIPVRNELYLNQTVDEVFKKASGEVELVVFLDDCWNIPLPPDNPAMTIVHSTKRMGLRGAINCAAEIGHGDYLMKIDAHCILCEGYDEILKSACDSDWVMTMIRFSMDADTWSIRKEKPPVIYEYLTYPIPENNGLHAQYWWKERDKGRKKILIDENMSSQGSFWFTPMAYFRKLIYPMSTDGYGIFCSEMQEIGLKVWLSGGKNMINKNGWYAHLWKGQGYRDKHLAVVGKPYTRIGHSEYRNAIRYTTDYWFNNHWEKRIHDLAWLVERFWPVPTWPEDRNLWTRLPS